MKRGDRIIRELREGAVTASELGLIVNWPMRTCSAWLGFLRNTGIVEGISRVRSAETKRLANVYAIKEGAVLALRRRTRARAAKSNVGREDRRLV